jgi:hypothetical protein
MLAAAISGASGGILIGFAATWTPVANNFVYAVATLTFSGSYPTGGDTLDFTTAADKWPTTQIVLFRRFRIACRRPRNLLSLRSSPKAQNGNGGYYVRGREAP